MKDRIKHLSKEVREFSPNSKEELESFRVSFLGKRGHLNVLFSNFKTLNADDKRRFGKDLNVFKTLVQDKIQQYKSSFNVSFEEKQIDLTRPSSIGQAGSKHPLTIVKNQIISIFSNIGFLLSDGPEIEDDWHNFSALNLPKEHPARDMQDTFFIQTDPDVLLRTHTSSVQIRYMEKNSPPIRILSPGRVFRNEAVSSRAHCIFHQIEGLYIDKQVSFSDLKQTLLLFAKQLFGEETKIRLRPSYFPFTEPSAEVDIYWGLNNETDYRITKGTGWLEIMGCGMVDPNVLENCKIDSNIYDGYAFGMGIERIAMLKYGITDLRLFYQNDVRFLNQFQYLS